MSFAGHQVEIMPFGDKATLISMGNIIDPEINSLIHHLKNIIELELGHLVSFLIPAYASLTVGYHNDSISLEAFQDRIIELIKGTESIKTNISQADTLNIPVCYASSFALDMDDVQKQTNVSFKEIVALHTSTPYYVYMMGFLPGFAYLGKSPDTLKVTRKKNPRLRVSQGAVGLAGLQAGVYPSEAPGGWQIIGNTPVPLFDLTANTHTLFVPGDFVKFYEVDMATYMALKTKYNKSALDRKSFILNA